MKASLVSSLCTILFILAFANPIFSQFRLKLGPSVGANYNIDSGSDLPQNGNGFGFVVGAQADMNFTPAVGLIANLQFYDNRSGSFTQSNPGQTINEQGNNVIYSVSDDYSANLAYFNIEVLFKVGLTTNNLFFFGGAAEGFIIAQSYDITETVTFPYPYQNNNQNLSGSGSFQNMNNRFELKFGVGYDIPAGSVFVTPQLSFGYGTSDVVQNVNWQITTIQGMITVKFNLI